MGRMSYLFETEEHAELRRNVKRFAEMHIQPHAYSWEESCAFPESLYVEAAAHRFLASPLLQSLGDMGATSRTPSWWARSSCCRGTRWERVSV